MKPNSLQQLYVEQLRDLYDAEDQIIKALPGTIEKAASPDLKEALSEHLKVTQAHAARLEQIFEDLSEKAKGEKCKGMQGVLQEGADLVGGIKDESVRDAAIIAAVQRVEHYEMAGYGTTRTYATLFGDENSAQLLQQTLDEEKEADQKLTTLAREINVNATTSATVESAKPSSARKRVA